MSEGSETTRAARAGSDGGEIWGAVKGDVSDLADVALKQGRHFVGAAKDQATSFADERKNLAAQAVADVASSLRESGKALEEQPNLNGFVSSAADGLDQLADTIRSRSFGEIYTDIEEVIRRRPLTTAAVTLVAGFLAARFIKSTSEQIARTEIKRRVEAGGGKRKPQRAAGRSGEPASSDA